MGKLQRAEKAVVYEAPKVSEETLDAGGNYVSSAADAPDGPGGAGTLGVSIIL